MCGSENYLGYRMMGLVDVYSRVWGQLFSIIRIVVGTVGVVEVPLATDNPNELVRFGQRPGTKEGETKLLSEGNYSCFPLSDELVESSLFDEVAAQLNFQMVSQFVQPKSTPRRP